MAKEILPAIYSDIGPIIKNTNAENLTNCIPVAMDDQMIGVHPRNQFTDTALVTPAASTDRGRGVTAFGGQYDLYCDEDTYYYDGGSQDMTATAGAGYAGNTGFNEEYLASFIQYNQTGVNNLVIVNAGHSSTHASATLGNIWYQPTAGAAPVIVTDIDAPGGTSNTIPLIRGGVSLDGYLFVANIQGTIYNCDLDDITSWSALSFITAEREADIGVYLGKHHDHVVYFGTKGIEFFYDNANSSGSPLQRRNDIFHSVGCYYPNSIVEVGDIIYFIGTDNSGWSRIYKLENFNIDPISTPKIEKELRDLAAGTYPDITALDSLMHDVYMTSMTLHDSDGLLFTMQGLKSWYWHQTTNKWCAWNFGASVTYGGAVGTDWSTSFPIVSANRVSASGTASRFQFTNGWIVYEAEPGGDSGIDDIAEANTPTSMVIFKTHDANTNERKRYNSVRVLTEPRADSSASFDAVQATIRWFDYDTAQSAPVAPTSFTGDRVVDLTSSRASVYRCGAAIIRQFLLDFSGHCSGEAVIVKGLEVDYDILRG